AAANVGARGGVSGVKQKGTPGPVWPFGHAGRIAESGGATTTVVDVDGIVDGTVGAPIGRPGVVEVVVVVVVRPAVVASDSAVALTAPGPPSMTPDASVEACADSQSFVDAPSVAESSVRSS